MPERELPSFDLVVATVDRRDELGRLLTSLGRQTHRRFRVLIADQNRDAPIEPVLARQRDLEIVHLRSDPGLSRARNAALRLVEADVVAFPDDDCVYAPDLLERVARRFAAEPELDGVTGREEPANASWDAEGGLLTRANVWNRAISFTIFLRAGLVGRVGAFDERLGLPRSSGEEIDYLIRALDAGATIEYDPSLVVAHHAGSRPLEALGARDGASIGYILRKHRYPRATVASMLVRPALGATLALARGDRRRARFHLETARGRVRGFRR